MKKAPAEARAKDSEVQLRLHWVTLVPLSVVNVPNLLDLLDQLILLTMLRQHKKEVKLGAPLQLDPGHAVVVNHRLDDVVLTDLPHCGDLCLLLLLSGRNDSGGVGFGHRIFLLWRALLRSVNALTRPLAVTHSCQLVS